MKKFLAVVMISALIFNGCATILKSGKTETIPVKSNPDSADVYLNGNLVGQTPTDIKISGKQKHTLEVKKEGYEPAKVDMRTHVQAGWIILDVLFGIVPIFVDAATGSWKSLNDKQVEVRLEQKK